MEKEQFTIKDIFERSVDRSQIEFEATPFQTQNPAVCL
jgi:hypothetical protein